MYIDLTQPFTSHMPVFPGDPSSEIIKIADVAKDGFADHQIKTAMHVGTHMDAPAHIIENGKFLNEYPADKFFGHGVLIDARGSELLDEGGLLGRDVRKNDIVLITFGWSDKFTHPDYFKDYPTITEGLAKKLVEIGVSMVGFDTPGPDKAPFKVHKILLGHNILIMENLTNLESLIGKTDFEIIALPAKFQTEAAACRVVAKLK